MSWPAMGEEHASGPTSTHSQVSMPRIPFDDLPDDARIWVFGSSDSLATDTQKDMLSAVDAWLDQWTAHGEPLMCGRDWREGRFLVVGVDQRTAGASGCSIDALFHVLSGLETTLGTTFRGGDRVFYRVGTEAILVADRESFAALAGKGLVDESTPVFDTAVTDAGSYRRAFELPLGESWHRELISPATATGSRPRTRRR
jgi:hypothetical protein